MNNQIAIIKGSVLAMLVLNGIDIVCMNNQIGLYQEKAVPFTNKEPFSNEYKTLLEEEKILSNEILNIIKLYGIKNNKGKNYITTRQIEKKISNFVQNEQGKTVVNSEKNVNKKIKGTLHKVINIIDRYNQIVTLRAKTCAINWLYSSKCPSDINNLIFKRFFVSLEYIKMIKLNCSKYQFYRVALSNDILLLAANDTSAVGYVCETKNDPIKITSLMALGAGPGPLSFPCLNITFNNDLIVSHSFIHQTATVWNTKNLENLFPIITDNDSRMIEDNDRKTKKTDHQFNYFDGNRAIKYDTTLQKLSVFDLKIVTNLVNNPAVVDNSVATELMAEFTLDFQPDDPRLFKCFCILPDDTILVIPKDHKNILRRIDSKNGTVIQDIVVSQQFSIESMVSNKEFLIVLTKDGAIHFFDADSLYDQGEWCIKKKDDEYTPNMHPKIAIDKNNKVVIVRKRNNKGSNALIYNIVSKNSDTMKETDLQKYFGTSIDEIKNDIARLMPKKKSKKPTNPLSVEHNKKQRTIDKEIKNNPLDDKINIPQENSIHSHKIVKQLVNDGPRVEHSTKQSVDLNAPRTKSWSWSWSLTYFPCYCFFNSKKKNKILFQE